MAFHWLASGIATTSNLDLTMASDIGERGARNRLNGSQGSRLIDHGSEIRLRAEVRAGQPLPDMEKNSQNCAVVGSYRTTKLDDFRITSRLVERAERGLGFPPSIASSRNINLASPRKAPSVPEPPATGIVLLPRSVETAIVPAQTTKVPGMMRPLYSVVT
jgi:hypothetical protein